FIAIFVVFPLKFMDLRERMSFLLVLLLLLAPAHSYAKAAEIVVFAQVGNSVTLLRKPWGKNENIHVNWYFNDQILIYRNPTASTQNQAPPNWQGRISLSTDFSLKISPVTENDFGIFECVQYELTDRTTDKYKLYQVKMSTPPPLLSGATLTLSCEIEREGFNLVHPSIHWLGPDDKIQNGYSNGNKYTLSVIKASGIHNGNWICVVQYGANSILNATTNVVIVEKAPVNIWLVVAIIGGILVLILLAGIAVIIICRHRKVMKYTRRKRRFCCCKK
ncbi:hypothetical protein QTP70_014017, partial [Hemibagrus guttatus]